MQKASNYDSKNSLLSIDFKDYKIPYDSAQGSRIVQHLQQSQQQLQFLKQKLTEAYEKLQHQIRANMQLTDNNHELQNRLKLITNNWQAQQRENKKLKQVMETMLMNRRMLEDEIEYTHARYKRIIEGIEEEARGKVEDLEGVVRKLRRQLEDGRTGREDRSARLEDKIQVLENQIRKLTQDKSSQISHLKSELQSYRNTLSPSPVPQTHKSQKSTRIQTFHLQQKQQNNQNINQNSINNIMRNSTIVQSKLTTDSRGDDDSISKWQKNKSVMELTDDQKLTRAQMEKKKVENQLMKLERLKRHAPEDRQVMDELEKKIYAIDSEISGLKRKIRQRC